MSVGQGQCARKVPNASCYRYRLGAMAHVETASAGLATGSVVDHPRFGDGGRSSGSLRQLLQLSCQLLGYLRPFARAQFVRGGAGCQQGYKILAIDDIKEVGRGDQELKCVGNAVLNTRVNNRNTVDIHYRYIIHNSQLSAQWSTEPWWE